MNYINRKELQIRT